MTALRPGQLPDLTGVNISVECSECDNTLEGHSMWSIRKTAQLHTTNGKCERARFIPCSVLTAYLGRADSSAKE